MRTLLELTRRRAAERGEQAAFTFLLDGESSELELSYGELDRRARAIAAALQSQGATGERVLLLFPPGLDYVAALFGCIYAGAVAVPAYPPSPIRPERTLPRLRAIVADSRARFALTTSMILPLAEAGFAGEAGLRWLATDALESGTEEGWRVPPVNGSSLALLQYTSGSTGAPKGVMLDHANLLHNSSLIEGCFEHTSELRGVIWLPPYHDMGLIGGIVGTVYAGGHTVLMSPLDFLERPLRWLQAITRFRATTSGGPNFAYDFCVRAIPPEKRHALDLSSWGVAFTGAETIRAETIDRFVEAFGPCGFRREAFYPCYGLAEATLIVAGGRKAAPPVILGSESGDAGHSMHVGCGTTLPGQRIAIVDPETKTLSPDLGEIWVQGPSVARGYWGKPDATVATFQAQLANGDGPYLRTGDLGFLAPDGQLYFRGRLKDLIIVRGVNHYPEDIEATVERSRPDLFRPGRVAAFSVEVEGGEGAVVIFELARNRAGQAEGTIATVRRVVAEEHQIKLHAVIFAKPGWIPRTSSGKIQRHLCRAAFESGAVESILEWRTDAVSPVDREDYVAPRTPTEERLVSIWAEVLEVERVGIRDNFFELGGDSIRTFQVIGRIREALGVELPPPVMFEAPTIEELVRLISEHRRDSIAPAPRIAVDQGPGLLSFGQERVWFLDQLEPGNPRYNLAEAVGVDGILRLQGLVQAFAGIVRRHEVLRTRFVAMDGKPMQRIEPAHSIDSPVVDLSSLPRGERRACARRLAAEESARPFDLTAARMVRVGLMRLGAAEHVLRVTMHHIASDGWSMGVLVRELEALYRAHILGVPPQLAELPIQYADYAYWQRQKLAGETLERQLSYWADRLKAAPELLELPTDRVRPAVQTFRGSSVPFSLAADSWASIRALSRREGATPFMTLLAAFQVLLLRYAGQEDVCVGSPIAGRTHPSAEGLIGFFVNTLVLRSDLSGDPTFAKLLSRVREGTLGAYANQDLPFERLVEQLRPARSLSHSPLFQVMFAWQNAPMGRLALPGLSLQRWEVEAAVAKFDVTLSLSEEAAHEATNGAPGVRGTLEYNRDLFDAPTISRMAVHLEVLLRGIVFDPDVRLSDLPLLGEAERGQLLVEWNDTEAEHSSGVSLFELLEKQASSRPDAVALEFEESCVSYRLLLDRSMQLASRLRASGVGPEVLVGVYMERSLEMVVALIAVLKAGGAYVPLEPSAPAERTRSMLADAQAPVVLADKASLTFLSALSCQTIVVDGNDSPEVCDTSETSGRPDPGSPAYMIFTSGSTGQPKGALNTHGAISNRLSWMQEAFGLSFDDRVLQKTPFGFDVSVWEFFWPFLTGARLVVAQPGAHKDPAYLVETIRDRMITTLHFVPSMLDVFLESEGVEGCNSLVRVICSGEALGAGQPEKLRSRLNAELHNLYGPTEAAVDVTFWDCAKASSFGPVPIGRPIANLQVHVLDPFRRPAPVGIAGELHIGGRGVCRGYLGQSALTADRFIPDPFDEDGERLYRTGDLARHNPDGAVEFLGRLDHQVKVRGFRIELGEVEATLLSFPGVHTSVVLAREDVPGEKRLVAYLAGAQARPLTEALRQHLHSRLPEYMIPSAFVFLDAFPLTTNGKVDRKALPAPDASVALSGYLAPRTKTEELVARIWVEVLRLDRVGVHDNFFDLGGHSLLAVQVSSRIRERFGVERSLRMLFETPTIAGLAHSVAALARLAGKDVERRLEVDDWSPAVITATAQPGGGPLSEAQERIWFLDQLEPGNPTYNIAGSLHLRGTLQVSAFEAGLSELRRRHQALRTVVHVVAGAASTAFLPAEPATLPVVDLLGLADPEATLRELRSSESSRSFELARGPLVRDVLIRTSQSEHEVLHASHHIVSDGWSNGVLVREVSAIYRAYLSGVPSPLTDPPLQYSDFAIWQRTRPDATLAGLTEFWRRRLSGAPTTLDLPTDHPRPATQLFRGACVGRTLPESLSSGIETFARSRGATVFMVLLAGFATVIGRLAGEEDFLIGCPIAGRTRKELEEVIGVFVNTVALRADLSGAPTFVELVDRIRATVLEAHEYQDAPFERVVRALNPVRDTGRTPLFQVFFNMLNLPKLECDLPGLEVEFPWDPGEIASKFDLTLYASPSDGLRFDLVYDSTIFSRARMQALLDQIIALLEAATAGPEIEVRRHSLLTPSAARVLPSPVDPLPFSWIGPVHELFARRARRAPERIAVVDPAESWTYGELDRESNRLANALLAAGIGSGDVVAIFAHRSASLVWALLGTLKAGAAFLILDPSYPVSRLLAYVAAAKPRGLLSLEAAGNLPEDLQQVASNLAFHGLLPEKGRSTPRFESLSDQDPGVSIDPADLAYIAFTSGSTGLPKGVLGRHRSLALSMPWLSDTFSLGEQDRFAMLSGLSHDPLHRDIFAALHSGGTICIPDPEARGAAPSLARWIDEQRVTIANLTPAQLEILLEAPDPRRISTLRWVFVVGDVLRRRDVERLHRIVPSVSAACFYGTTEAQQSLACTILPRSGGGSDDRAEKATVPIGRGIPGVQLLVVNTADRLCGIGEVGEICIRSSFLARGYLGDLELTRQRFTPNPISQAPDDMMYRTGDLGRYLPDGSIEFAGRSDNQVKVRGFRIELGEVEARLDSNPAVRSSIVVARPGPDGHAQLLAYLLTIGDVRSEELRNDLRQSLPAYMVPSAFKFMDAFPLLPNGKIDRRALPEPDRPDRVGSSALPETELQRKVAALWGSVLAIEHIGIDDNFFDLGGHSLMLVKLHAKLVESLEPNLRLVDLFRFSTIRSLSAFIAHGEAQKPAADVSKQRHAIGRLRDLRSGRTESNDS